MVPPQQEKLSRWLFFGALAVRWMSQIMHRNENRTRNSSAAECGAPTTFDFISLSAVFMLREDARKV